MSEDSLTETDIVHEPTQSAVESTNVWSFMQTHDIDDYDELIERTTTDLDGVPASGVDWFWDELVDYLDIEFYEDYDTVRDNKTRRVSTANGETVYDGPQFTDWYPGGSINLAHNVLDRHAAVDSDRRNTVACLWEGEDGETRDVTYHELHRQSNKVTNALTERGIEQGDTVEYQNTTTTMSEVTSEVATLSWTISESSERELAEGGNVTLADDTRYFAHFKGHSEEDLRVILAPSDADWSAYQTGLGRQDYYHERQNGLWGVIYITAIASLLIVGLAYMPVRG